MKPQMKPQSQQGFALIGVLIIVGLITSATVAMAVRQTSDIDMTYQVVRADQSALHARALELWAAKVLQQDSLQNSVDTVEDNWNQPLQDIPMQQGTINAEISDLQSRYNINNLLLDSEQSGLELTRFKRLLNNLGLDEQIADAVLDWIDADTETRYPNGAEDDYYLSLKPAYRSANQVMQDISELRKVRGIDQGSYERLLPYLVALPVGTEVNLNTALPEVVMALADGIGEGDALSISLSMQQQSIENATAASGAQGGDVAAATAPAFTEGSTSYTFQYQQWFEQDGGSDNISALTEENPDAAQSIGSAVLQAAGIDSRGVGIASRYFMLKGVVEYDGEAFIIGSLLYRDPASGDVYTIARKYGEFYYP